MLKKVSLLMSFLFFSILSFAQVGNYNAGNQVTINPAVAPHAINDVINAPGSSTTSGDYNTAIGAGAASSLSSGSQTIFIGTAAGTSHTSQSDNIIIGAFAADQSTSGTDNLIIGTRAARTLNGTDNVVIGVEAGMVMSTSADDNVIIGEEAGQALVDGDDNVFIGEDAGFNTIGTGTSGLHGDDNTFVGNTAGRSNTYGYANAFVGDEAGYDNTTGHWNTAVGDSALIDNSVGINNTALGHGAGCATEYADYNTFIGAYSGGDNNRNNNTSNANRNTYVGAFSGFSNRMGEDNVGMGTYSGYGGSYPLTGVNGQWGGQGSSTNRSRTTFIGAQSAAKNNDVTVIGYKAEVNGQYGIAIGNEADLESATGGIGMGYQTALSNNGDYSVGIGYQANISENDAIGIGRFVDVDKAESVAIGANSVIQNDGAIVIGYGANSMDVIDNTGGDPDATNNIAIGYNASTSAFNSIAIGNAASAVNDNTMVLGGATNPLSVGIATDAPSTNASLDLADVNKGFLVNRVTTAERNTMTTTPASGVALGANDIGLMVYDTDDKLLYIWNGADWGEVGSNAGSGVSAVPDLLNYQSAVRDGSGIMVTNQSVSFRMSIIDVTNANTTVYTETHAITTSAQGLVDFKIGGGTIVSGLFTDIDWSHNNSLQIELDVTGGSSYVNMGTTSFVSVPYALRAKYAENLTSSSHAKMNSSSKDDRIQALENEVQELKKMMNQLINKK